MINKIKENLELIILTIILIPLIVIFLILSINLFMVSPYILLGVISFSALIFFTAGGEGEGYFG